MENYFVSINIPEDISYRIRSKIEGQFDRVVTGKKTQEENYHITIKFFDGIDYKTLGEIKEKLSEVKFEKFNIRIGKLEFFDRRNFGVLWASAKSENLKKFAKTVWNVVGWDKRKFKAHITVMKTKKVLDLKKMNNIIGALRFGNLEFDVDKFYLMKSTSDKEGANYEIIQEYNLN